MSVIPSQFDLLAQQLDLAGLRHRVIAQNIANVNTPGYRRLEVSFEDALSSRLTASRNGPAPHPQLTVVESPQGTLRQDGNNVDIDIEIGQLNKNTLLYGTYAQILAAKIAAMRAAIGGR